MSNEIDKRGVKDMFNSIAQRYDFLNHLLTLGIDIWWRKRAVATVRTTPVETILDIATGTADLTLQLCRTLKPSRLVGLDLSVNMLEMGRRKVERMGLSEIIELREENCESISMADHSCDLVTIGFGIRNFQDPDRCLAEALRVLRPDGQIIILEFSRPTSAILRTLFDLYFRHILPLIGRIVSRNRSAYSYLPASVIAFPSGEAFCTQLENVGFKQVCFTPLTFGIVTIYSAFK